MINFRVSEAYNQDSAGVPSGQECPQMAAHPQRSEGGSLQMISIQSDRALEGLSERME